MSDEATAHEPEEETGQPRSDWASDAEAALEGVGDALREAWDASRESRLNALESAKKLAKQLGEAIDQGVTAARGKWESQGPAEPADSEGDAPQVKAPLMGPDEGRSEEH
jgi:hypothetical protein